MKRACRAVVVAGVLGALGVWMSGFAVVGAQEQVPPAVTFSPSSVDFGDQVAKEASTPVRITITNSGQGDLYINSVRLDGDNPGDFVASGDSCTGSTIKPGKSCVVDVVMTPSVTGPRRATLTFTDNGGTQTVSLSGNGINSAAVPPR